MPLAFAKTLRAQEAERSPASVVAAAVAIALLGAWLLWFFRAHVAIYEASERARIEVAGSAHAIEAPVAGRIVSLDLVLERRVQAGDVLVVLDSTLVEQQLAEAKARYDALTPRIEARRAEIASEENLRTRDSAESGTGIAAARARLLEAEAAAALARDELARFESLFRGGTISEVQLVRARSDAAQRKASADSARLEVARLGRQGETSSSEVSVRISRLKSEISDLEGQVESSSAAVAVLRESLARHTLRAPIAGRIAEAGNRRPGGFVQAGERLGVIVPEGGLRASAEFTPERAIGRIQVGQRARLRLDGYPWMQYGSIHSRVDRVGAEPRDGLVHVEFTIEPDPESAIPMQHGLSGQMEVAVEEVTPYTLALRATGRGLSKEGRRD